MLVKRNISKIISIQDKLFLPISALSSSLILSITSPLSISFLNPIYFYFFLSLFLCFKGNYRFAMQQVVWDLYSDLVFLQSFLLALQSWADLWDSFKISRISGFSLFFSFFLFFPSIPCLFLGFGLLFLCFRLDQRLLSTSLFWNPILEILYHESTIFGTNVS